MRVSLDQIAAKVRSEYGSKGFKITRTSENVYVDAGAFYLMFTICPRMSDGLNVCIGWESNCDSVVSAEVLCTLDTIVEVVNKLCYALIDNITEFIQEVPNESKKSIPNSTVLSHDPSGVSLPIG